MTLNYISECRKRLIWAYLPSKKLNILWSCGVCRIAWWVMLLYCPCSDGYLPWPTSWCLFVSADCLSSLFWYILLSKRTFIWLNWLASLFFIWPWTHYDHKEQIVVVWLCGLTVFDLWCACSVYMLLLEREREGKRERKKESKKEKREREKVCERERERCSF